METIRTLFKTRMDLDTQRPASLAAVSSAGGISLSDASSVLATPEARRDDDEPRMFRVPAHELLRERASVTARLEQLQSSLLTSAEVAAIVTLVCANVTKSLGSADAVPVRSSLDVDGMASALGAALQRVTPQTVAEALRTSAGYRGVLLCPEDGTRALLVDALGALRPPCLDVVDRCCTALTTLLRQCLDRTLTGLPDPKAGTKALSEALDSGIARFIEGAKAECASFVSSLVAMEADMVQGLRFRPLLDLDLQTSTGRARTTDNRRVAARPEPRPAVDFLGTPPSPLQAARARALRIREPMPHLQVSGYLERLTSSGKWARRWVYVDGADHVLVYSRHPKSLFPSEIVPLIEARLVNGALMQTRGEEVYQPGHDRLAFTLVHERDGGRLIVSKGGRGPHSLVLRAADRETKERWVAALLAILGQVSIDDIDALTGPVASREWASNAVAAAPEHASPAVLSSPDDASEPGTEEDVGQDGSAVPDRVLLAEMSDPSDALGVLPDGSVAALVRGIQGYCKEVAARLAEETPKAASHLLIQAVEENLAPALQRHILQPATFQALATQEVRQQMDALRHKLEELDRAMQTGDADMP